MIDLLIQSGLSNACIAFLLAVIAMIVGTYTKRPQLAHLLWLLFFIKLVTPPIINVPIDFWDDPAVAMTNHEPVENQRGDEISDDRLSAVDIESMNESDSNVSIASFINPVWSGAKPWLGKAWLLGILLIAGYSCVRIARFDCLLHQCSQPAPWKIQQIAKQLATQLNLKTLPDICITSAQLVPMVWWIGGRVHVVIPQSLFQELQEHQWRLIVAHELAHVKRRDYLVRWLEWLACTCFWWNPVVWWAQKNLRATEEICCDALVLSSLNPGSHSYARSILTAVESFVSPEFRPPAMASEINSGGFLERRFELIMSGTSNQKSSRWLQLGVALFSLLVIPFGMVGAQDFDKVQKRLENSVKKGELSERQADAMMAALRRASDRNPDANPREQRLRGGEMRIKAAIADGKITKEQGRARLEALREKMSDREASDRDKKLREVGMKIRAAVADGKISAEEGRERMQAFKNRLESRDDNRAEDRMEGAMRRIKAAVEAGKMSREEAEKAAEELHRRMQIAEMEKAAEHMREAVEAGKMKAEDMRHRMVEMQRRISERALERDSRIKTFGAIEAGVRRAVEEGKLSREEAGRKMEEIRRKMFNDDRVDRDDRRERRRRDRDDDDRLDLEELAKQIKMAVKAGEISEKEGLKKWRGLQQHIEKLEKRRNRDRDDNPDWEELRAIEIELRKVVAAGKLSEQDVRKKFEAMLNERLRERREHDDEYEGDDHEDDDDDDGE